MDANGKVDFDKVLVRFKEIGLFKVSLANKYFTNEAYQKAKSLSDPDQQRLLDIMMGGLCNTDSSVGAYATSPDDYDKFSFFLEPLIREYHKI